MSLKETRRTDPELAGLIDEELATSGSMCGNDCIGKYCAASCNGIIG